MHSNNALDLYARFEELIPFENEIASLYKRYIELLREFGVKTLLDVGCGSGKFARDVASFGIKTSGIDLSASMIEKARKLGVDARQADLCDETDRYDAITAVFDVVNYLDQSELNRFFGCACQALNEKGVFLFDSNTLFGFTGVAVGSLVLSRNGVYATVRSEFENNQLISDFVLFEPNDDGLFCKNEDSITQYFHTSKQISDSLKKAGFVVLGKFELFLYGEAKSDKTLWVAQKA